MNSRALRFTLAALCVAAVCGAAYAIWLDELKRAGAAAESAAVDRQAHEALRTLLDIRSAQPGYVAAGQGEDFWSGRIDTLLGSVKETFEGLRSDVRVAGDDLEAASEALEDFERLDRRAREYSRGGQRLLASDLVFSDGIGTLEAAVAAIDRLRGREVQERQAAVDRHGRRQLTAAAGAMGLCLLAVFVLARVPAPPPAIPAAAARVNGHEPAADYPIQRRVQEPPLPRAPEPALPAPAAADTAPLAPPPPVLPDLTGVAAVCTDLARVLDTAALPAMLQRAAGILDASGIVLWIADPDRRQLAPVVAHGYPPHLLARMGTIDRDAENATAAAFRTGTVQTVKADAISNGAVAAPLLAAGGAVGVMAAEMRGEGEQDEARRAVAMILAAQLATLMGPPAARPQGAAEAV